MPDDHSSHQIGLDADILLWQHPVATQHILSTAQREHIHPQSVLNENKTEVDEFKWASVNEEILKITASDNRVDRIFLNPVIKKKLCSRILRRIMAWKNTSMVWARWAFSCASQMPFWKYIYANHKNL